MFWWPAGLPRALEREVCAVVTQMADAPEQCELLKTFFTRLGGLFLAAVAYVAYTGYRMYRGIDKRSFGEFAAMFFNLGAHQALGGLLLLLYSLQQDGLDGLVWYAATFDFEFAFTMLYIKAVKETLAPRLFKRFKAVLGMELYLGQVGDETTPFRWTYCVVQFFVSVCVVGFLARLLSLTSISLLQEDFLPYNPVRHLAEFYYALPMDCTTKALLALYLKPMVLDALTFTLSDWLLSTKKTQELPQLGRSSDRARGISVQPTMH